eukprot:2038131-Rhodomonas_salina.1
MQSGGARVRAAGGAAAAARSRPPARALSARPGLRLVLTRIAMLVRAGVGAGGAFAAGALGGFGERSSSRALCHVLCAALTCCWSRVIRLTSTYPSLISRPSSLAMPAPL